MQKQHWVAAADALDREGKPLRLADHWAVVHPAFLEIRDKLQLLVSQTAAGAGQEAREDTRAARATSVIQALWL